MDAPINILKTVWITEKQLGTVRVLRHRGNKIQYRLPPKIEQSITLRFKGRGKTSNTETGDLMLKVQVDRGQDRHESLWLSETDARQGCQKDLVYLSRLFKDIMRVHITVPMLSNDGSIVRIKNRGHKTKFRWGMPIFNRPNGDLLVKFRVFPDSVTAYYRHVDALTTEDMALEGWVYRQRDEILEVLGASISASPVSASEIADIFNTGGWRAISKFLVAHLEVQRFSIQFDAVADLPVPGQFQKSIKTGTYGEFLNGFRIRIRSEFINDPFAVTAIIAHELCHIIEDQVLSQRGTKFAREKGQALVELERRVDLLMFIYQLGEFQLRVARQSRKTFGYFNQEIFERMYVILQRGKKTH